MYRSLQNLTVWTFALTLFLAIDVSLLSAGDWPQWRGPDSNGASRETGLPVTWSKDSGIAWQCPLPEWGNSTPVISGDAIFLTSQVDNSKLLLVKISKKRGEIEWTREVASEACPASSHNKGRGAARGHQWFDDSQNYASPSPATDGQLVVVSFGSGDLAAYDFEGKELWHRNLQKEHGEYSIWWGYACSPVLCGDLVITVCLQDSCVDLGRDPPIPSYVIAHDKRTGEPRWKTMRMTSAQDESCDSYATPIVRQNGNRQELVVMAGQMLDAYDPATGKQLWFLPELTGSRTVTGLTAGKELIYATQGMRKPMLAVRPGGDGQRPREDIVWEVSQGTPDSSTPTLWNNLLFFVANDGIARCLDATDGRLLWKERLSGEYRASPLAADGRIYFLNTQGLATVVAAAANFERLAENQIEDDTLATPIVSDGHIYLRGRKALYCLGDK